MRISGRKLSSGEDNIITRAYRMLQKKFPKLGGVSVSLQKKIPMGAGLGGGSSNAATFLLGMKKLYGFKLSQKELLRMGAQLGADVPFFLCGANQALGTRRGDVLKPMKMPTKLWFLLIVSKKGLTTKTVFLNMGKIAQPLSLTKLRPTVRLLNTLLRGRKLKEAAQVLENDLEDPAFRLRPSLRKLIKRVNQKGFSAARMTGSGPTIFAILSHQEKAKQLARSLRRTFSSKEIFVCHTF